MEVKYDIYISYSHRDYDIVKEIVSVLEDQGLSCWVDYVSIKSGFSITEEISSAIKSIVNDTKIFMCIIGPNTQDSSGMINEIRYAIQLGAQFILPVYVNVPQPPPRLQFTLAEYNSISIGPERDYSNLIDSVQTMLGKNAWVFVSHSNKDFGKIIRLRNKLEARHYKPLLFFLKCLDDDDEIFELIKREIKARDRFILCDSKNSQKSEWVQKETEYIKSLQRPYEVIDIDADEPQIDNAIDRFDRRSTVYIWSTETSFNQMVAHELMKKSFRVILLPMDYYQNNTHEQRITDGYVLMFISRKLTEQETNAINLKAKTSYEYTYPIAISEDAFANRELFRELQNGDGIKSKIYLLNSDIINEAILSFDSNEERAVAIVKDFVWLDDYLNNSQQ